MRVVVFIPDRLFRQAEALSHGLGIPRGQLYSKALAAFVHQHSEREITARLDGVVSRLSSSDRAAWDGPALEVIRRTLR